MEFRSVKNLEVVKFIIVGVVNTIAGSAIMFTLYNLIHFSYWTASACNYIIGSIVSYFLNKNWTFENKEKNYLTAVKFALNISICYLLAYGMAKPFTIWLMKGLPQRIQDNAAMVVGMVLFTAFNYLGQKNFAFKRVKEVN